MITTIAIRLATVMQLGRDDCHDHAMVYQSAWQSHDHSD
jgi:hypothetical protein